MAAHESPHTAKLYDRTGDEITLDEVANCYLTANSADGRRLTLATGDLRSSGKKRASAMPDTPSEFVPFPVNLTMLDHIMLPEVGKLRR
jgi:hypothetical protein